MKFKKFHRLVRKGQTGMPIVMPSDNTRVVITYERPATKLTPKQKLGLKLREVLEVVDNANKAVIYDTNKARFNEDLQNAYNNNFFGYGVFGNQTHYNPVTEGEQIRSNAYYTLDNILNASNASASMAAEGLIRGIIPIRNLKAIEPYMIGEGAESVVYKNNPVSVVKISEIMPDEMEVRNTIPFSKPHKFVGYTIKDDVLVPVYTLGRMRILNDNNFSKYIQKLDKSMLKKGYKIVNDPDVQYRAYTNGDVVIDDVSPYNVGVDLLGRPKMIDFGVIPVSDWLDMGYAL